MTNREALESYLYLENRESICIEHSERYEVLSQALDRLEELEEENKLILHITMLLKERLKISFIDETRVLNIVGHSSKNELVLLCSEGLYKKIKGVLDNEN